MPSLDNAFGIHEYALHLQGRRTELLAANLANVDTPGYKARDFDYQALLRDYQARLDGKEQQAGGMRATHARHFSASGPDGLGEPLYREPMQPALDGNTVDSQVEKAEFMQNAIHYQTTLGFIDGRIKTLRRALRGD